MSGLAQRGEIGHGAPARMTLSRRRRLLSLAFAALLVALFSVACSGESEGQRCELTDDPGGTDNSPGTSDCANGLKCYSGGTLGGAAAQYASAQSDPNFGICCPYNRTQATTSICSLQPSPPGGDAGFPAEASTGDSAVPDASTDSPEDAPNDSPADSPPSDAAEAG
jgi:hypothetical protein